MWFTESLILRGSFLVLASAASAAGPSSCSKPAEKSPAALGTIELLDMIEAEQRRHDPNKYIEIDLGKFQVTHVLDGEQGYLYVQFHLFGVLPQAKQEQFAHDLPQYDKRLRDAVISLVQRSETAQLTDASLMFLKAEMVEEINRILQSRLLKDVAFSDFSVDRG